MGGRHSGGERKGKGNGDRSGDRRDAGGVIRRDCHAEVGAGVQRVSLARHLPPGVAEARSRHRNEALQEKLRISRMAQIGAAKAAEGMRTPSGV
jgi:hypothetical protein